MQFDMDCLDSATLLDSVAAHTEILYEVTTPSALWVSSCQRYSNPGWVYVICDGCQYTEYSYRSVDSYGKHSTTSEGGTAGSWQCAPSAWALERGYRSLRGFGAGVVEIPTGALPPELFSRTDPHLL